MVPMSPSTACETVSTPSVRSTPGDEDYDLLDLTATQSTDPTSDGFAMTRG